MEPPTSAPIDRKTTLAKRRRPGTWLLLIIVLVHLLFSNAVQAEDVPPTANDRDRPKVGLVLSGGGARGAAQIGVLKVLEELRVPIDYIAGTSMGAIIGGLYASGMSVKEIEFALLNIDWEDTFDDVPPRAELSFRRKRDDDLNLLKKRPGLKGGELQIGTGLILGQKFDIVLTRLTLPVAEVRDFNDLSTPFRAVATDITTGREVILDRGNLARAIRASMSVPGAFAAVEIDGRLLVDGGVSNNLPIDVVRDMGADVLIVVDISTPLYDRHELNSATAILDQLTGILSQRNAARQIATLSEADILIVPALSDISASDFTRVGDAIPTGIAAAERVRKRIAELSLTTQRYAQYLVNRNNRKPGSPIVQFVRLVNQSRLSDDFLMARIRLEVGRPLDMAQMEVDIDQLYGLDVFESIRYEIVREHEKTGVVIYAKEKSWGPNYIQLGFALSGDFEGESTFNISLAHTRTTINTLNGEWRTLLQGGKEPKIMTELYQPLDVDSRYYFTPKLLLLDKENLNIFEGERIVSEYRLSRYGLVLAAGRELGAWGDLRLGWRRYSGDADVRVGDPSLQGFEFEEGALFVRFSVDKLDNLRFPGSGVYSNLAWIASRERFGADDSFDQILFDTVATKRWGRQNLIAGMRVFTTLDDNAPIQNLFRAGGFQNLSGFKEDALSGQHYTLLRLGTTRRVNDISWLPVYTGASFEFGNVWQRAEDIALDKSLAGLSAFVGADTAIGPFYLAYGYAEGGHHSFYVFLGKRFRRKGELLFEGL